MNAPAGYPQVITAERINGGAGNQFASGFTSRSSRQDELMRPRANVDEDRASTALSGLSGLTVDSETRIRPALAPHETTRGGVSTGSFHPDSVTNPNDSSSSFRPFGAADGSSFGSSGNHGYQTRHNVTTNMDDEVDSVRAFGVTREPQQGGHEADQSGLTSRGDQGSNAGDISDLIQASMPTKPGGKQPQFTASSTATWRLGDKNVAAVKPFGYADDEKERMRRAGIAIPSHNNTKIIDDLISCAMPKPKHSSRPAKLALDSTLDTTLSMNSDSTTTQQPMQRIEDFSPPEAMMAISLTANGEMIKDATSILPRLGSLDVPKEKSPSEASESSASNLSEDNFESVAATPVAPPVQPPPFDMDSAMASAMEQLNLELAAADQEELLIDCSAHFSLVSSQNESIASDATFDAEPMTIAPKMVQSPSNVTMKAAAAADPPLRRPSTTSSSSLLANPVRTTKTQQLRMAQAGKSAEGGKPAAPPRTSSSVSSLRTPQPSNSSSRLAMKTTSSASKIAVKVANNIVITPPQVKMPLNSNAKPSPPKRDGTFVKPDSATNSAGFCWKKF